jgi:hypothetical protein
MRLRRSAIEGERQTISEPKQNFQRTTVCAIARKVRNELRSTEAGGLLFHFENRNHECQVTADEWTS